MDELPLWEQIRECHRMLDVALRECKERGRRMVECEARYYTVKAEESFRLREEGYVERRVDPDDRRATRVVLTELGRARACELQDEQNERLEQLFGRLTDDEKRQLIALIDKLLGAPVRPGPSGEMYRM